MNSAELEVQASSAALSKKQLRWIVRTRSERGGAGEAHWLELKEDIASQGNRRREDLVTLLGHLVSLANSGGGYLVFGVGDQGDLIGISEHTKQMLDPTRIRDQMDTYSPNAHLETHATLTEYHGKTYGSLWAKPARRPIIFDKPGDYTDSQDRQQQAFKDGVLYSRDSGGRIRASQTELERLIRRSVEQRLSDVVARIEQVVHVPPKADLIATHPSDSSRAYRLVDKGEGEPVQVVSDSSEASVSLHEVFRSDIPYEATEDEVAGEVRLWKTRPDHRVSKEVCFSWYLDRDQISWNADSAKFCLLSACGDWGYPMFWARWLAEHDANILEDILWDLINDPTYPEIQYAPYMAAGFFWSDCEDFLEAIKDGTYTSARRTAEKLGGMLDNREQFLLNARSPGTTIRVDDTELRKNELLEDRDAAIEAFDQVVERRHQAAQGKFNDDQVQGLSTVGHQLDLICFAEDVGGQR